MTPFHPVYCHVLPFGQKPDNSEIVLRFSFIRERVTSYTAGSQTKIGSDIGKVRHETQHTLVQY